MERFEALATAKRPHDLPRLADPEAARVLRTIWAAAEPDPNTGPDRIAAAMLSSTIESFEIGVLDAYIHFPAKSPIPPELPASPPDPADTDHLATLFGPELGQSLAASVAAIAHLSTTVERYRATPPAPEAAHLADDAKYAPRPNLRIIVIAQGFMAAPTFGPDNVTSVAAAFADHGADLAITLSQADRARFAFSVAAIAQKLDDGPARRDLGRFVDELRAAPCGPLRGIP